MAVINENEKGRKCFPGPIRRLIPFVFTLFVLVFSASLTVAQSPNEAALRKRVDLFYKHFVDGDVDKMWTLVSKANRERRHENSERRKRYEELLKVFGRQSIKVCVGKIKIEQKKAIVPVEIGFWDERAQVWRPQVSDNIWIFEANDWYFETPG